MFVGLWRKLAAAALAIAILWPAHSASALQTRVQGIAPDPPHPTGIVINIPALTLYWFKDGSLVRSFPIATGKASTPTPTGSYQLITRAKDPWWQPPWGGPIVPPGPDNALSTRWLEFLPTYGIHGTPWPDYIGVWGSYGCVRMYREDAEWLYDQVSLGTPVTVTYEPVQLQRGFDGRRYLAVYPDPYSKGSPSVDTVLAAAGINPTAPQSRNSGLYAVDAKVLVHGARIDAIIHTGQHYIAARALAEQMSAELTWNPATQTVSLDGHELPTVLWRNSGYVAADAAIKALGVDASWDSTTNTMALKGRPIFLKGKLVARSGYDFNGETYLPVRAVAEAAGARVQWDESRNQALVNGVALDSRLHGDRAYASASLLAQRLGLTVERQGQAVALN